MFDGAVGTVGGIQRNQLAQDESLMFDPMTTTLKI